MMFSSIDSLLKISTSSQNEDQKLESHPSPPSQIPNYSTSCSEELMKMAAKAAQFAAQASLENSFSSSSELEPLN